MKLGWTPLTRALLRANNKKKHVKLYYRIERVAEPDRYTWDWLATEESDPKLWEIGSNLVGTPWTVVVGHASDDASHRAKFERRCRQRWGDQLELVRV